MNVNNIQIIMDNVDKSSAELSALTGLSKEAILRYCKKNKIKLKGMKASYNINYFEKIDSEEKAYFLGFLYADGYILNGRKTAKRKESDALGLSVVDLDVLEKLKKALESNHPINVYKRESEQAIGRIIVYGEKITKDLIDKGMFKNKTLILKFPNSDQLPDELRKDFVRGYLDGDGGFYHTKLKDSGYDKFKISICGTKEILEGIQEFLGTSVSLSQRYPERNKNNYTLEYSGRKQVLKIINFLYRDSTVSMDRKYQKYVELTCKYGES